MTRKRESGQALALTAVALAILLGFAGLAVDMGVLRYEKHLQQTAADAAAIAAANELRDGTSTGSAVILAGQNAASANGFADNSAAASGSNGSVSTCTSYATNAAVTSSTVLPVCVEINNPPQLTTDPHYNDPYYVEAYVAANHPTYFMRIFGITNEPVVTRAVATLVGESGSGSGCVYATDQGTLHGIGGMKTNGTPTVNAPNCGFYDDGAWTTDGSSLNITAGSIGVITNSKDQGTVTCENDPANCPAVMPVPVSDPLENYVQGITTGAASTGSSFNQSSPVPGTYTNIDISGGTVTLAPGTYYVENGLTVNGTANVSCAGCTFVILGGSVTINGSGNVQLSAPDTGTYAGILFYQAPSDSGPSNVATINGNSNSYFQGALYFPSELLTFGGTDSTGAFNSGAAYTIIDASDVQFSGTATVDIGTDYSSLPGGVSPVENAILVE